MELVAALLFLVRAAKIKEKEGVGGRSFLAGCFLGHNKSGPLLHANMFERGAPYPTAPPPLLPHIISPPFLECYGPPADFCVDGGNFSLSFSL